MSELVEPKRLKPILDRKQYSETLEREISEFWLDLLYRPLLKILGMETTLRNKRMDIPIAELLPNPHNREISREKVELIKADILKTKALKPFVVAEVLTDAGPQMMITDGHHRHVAILELIESGEIKDSICVPAVTSGEDGIKTADGMAKKRLNASKASFIAALRAGRIQYQDGYFYGEFNAAISRELRAFGAKYDKVKKAFKISLSELPMAERGAVAENANALRTKQKAVQEYLDQLPNMAQEKKFGFSFVPIFDKVIDGLEAQFKKTTADFITVEADMTEGITRTLAEDYLDSLDLVISGWSNKKTARLRAKLEPLIFSGFRADKIAQTIQFEAGATVRRAKFIARQETSLLVSKYREQRYKEIGLNQYEWSTSHDERVRKDHKELNGKIFNWDNPPITDRATGQRNNPGEDFNCRCIAIPILT